MDDIEEIIRRRSAPGILIFDPDATLLFCNRDASELIASLPDLYETIRSLCRGLKESAGISAASGGADTPGAIVYRSEPAPPLAIRVFPAGENGEGGPRHLMVLLERVVEKRTVDVEKAKAKFHLSKREVEVLSLISGGLANREISERLFICEQTVKDHIRNIMRKVGVNSRSALISALQ